MSSVLRRKKEKKTSSWGTKRPLSQLLGEKNDLLME